MDAKPWNLVAPDWAQLDTIWRSPLPFVLWPVCDKTLLDYWLDEAVREGVPSVTIEAVDRPHLLRRWLDQRDLWSRSIEIRSQRDAAPDAERIVMDRLPGQAEPARAESAPGLLWRWYDLQVEALKRRNSGMVHLDHELSPGVWVGPGARIDPGATLVAPCWVGSYAMVGDKCRLGPNAFIGHGAYLDEDAEVNEAIVCADTYVGSHTSLRKMAAQGGLLLDLEKGLAVEVVDPFVMGPVNGSASRTPFTERLFAWAAGPVLELAARICARGQAPTVWEAQLSRSQHAPMRDYPRGPLCLRRAAWLRLVAKGRMRLAGILPRRASDWERLPAEARAALEQAPAGVFALSDLYQCHSPQQADEWTHALFQAGFADGTGRALTRKNIAKIALTSPVSE